MISDLGLLASRLGLGLALASHGAQKAYGWFEGPGPEGAAGFMHSLGLRPGETYATAASYNEIVSGLLIALGLGGPTGPAGVVSNMIVAVELTQRVIDPMIRRKFGRIVNITSGTVKMPQAGLDLSSGARAGLTAFLAGVARSVAASNVTINFIMPGAFETDRLRSSIESNAKKQGVTYDAAAGQRINTIPAKRFGEPGELGATCAFLCSQQAGFITGQSILIDGGAFPGTY